MLVKRFDGVEGVKRNEKDTERICQSGVEPCGSNVEESHYDHIVEYISERQLVCILDHRYDGSSYDRMILFGSLFLEKGSFCGI